MRKPIDICSDINLPPYSLWRSTFYSAKISKKAVGVLLILFLLMPGSVFGFTFDNLLDGVGDAVKYQ
jgi:hypothetical protein